MTDLAPSAAAVTRRLIELLDARLPGQLEALYLVGSIALRDYQEGVSDVDFIAVLAEPHDAAVLAAIHAELARTSPGLHCDGIYLKPGELSVPPEGLGIEVREGQLDPRSEGERHAVTWLTLADAGIALRGQAPNGRWIAADRNAAIHHSRGNLQTYWRKWLETRRRLISPGGLNLLADEAVVWGCLGVARLHATIAQGRVRSKTGAGQHALEAFPDHARVVRESLRLRTEPGAPPVYRSPLVRRRDLIAFMEAVIGSGV